MLRFFFCSCVLAAFTVGQAHSADDKIDVRLNWKPGSRYTQSMQVNQVVGIPRHGQATAETRLDLGINVSAGKESNRLLKISYEMLKIDIDLPLPMTDKKFDSAKPNDGNPDMAAIYANMRESKSEVVVDGRGKVSALRGVEKLAAENPVLAKFMGREQMQNLLQQCWLLDVPGKPVSRGDTWSFRMNFPTPLGNVVIRGDYKLGGRETLDGSPCVAIEMSGVVAGDLSEGAKADEDEEVRKFQIMLAAMGLKIYEGRLTGRLLYDPKLGQIRRSEIETNVRIGVAKYPENGQPTEIPLRQKFVSTLAAANEGR